MKISVIIPTINRSKDLKTLLDSITVQTLSPFEVIIVDQSDDDKTEKLLQTFKKNIPVKYIHSSRKSLSHCRNIGIKNMEGEVAAFLDDDTQLMPDYLEQIKNFYTNYPEAIGGMSKIINHLEFKQKLLGKGLLHILYKIVAVFFGLDSFKKGFLVLPSSRNIPYFESQLPLPAQWLSGVSWYKKNIFDEFHFEEKFERWAFGEDRMLSYQIVKKYPGSLYYYPGAQLYHYESDKNRLDNPEMISMKVLYQFWFFYSCLDKHPFYYWWGNFGEIILHFLNASIGREPLIVTWLYIKSNFKLICSLREVKAGRFAHP